MNCVVCVGVAVYLIEMSDISVEGVHSVSSEENILAPYHN